jgi:hypothetical protein
MLQEAIPRHDAFVNTAGVRAEVIVLQQLCVYISTACLQLQHTTSLTKEGCRFSHNAAVRHHFTTAQVKTEGKPIQRVSLD